MLIPRDICYEWDILCRAIVSGWLCRCCPESESRNSFDPPSLAPSRQRCESWQKWVSTVQITSHTVLPSSPQQIGMISSTTESQCASICFDRALHDSDKCVDRLSSGAPIAPYDAVFHYVVRKKRESPAKATSNQYYISWIFIYAPQTGYQAPVVAQDHSCPLPASSRPTLSWCRRRPSTLRSRPWP